MIELTPHPAWVVRFLESLAPYEDRIVNHIIFQEIREHRLGKGPFQGALINFFPLIQCFPQYLAITLAKVRSNSEWDERTRQWLIGNISQERCHTEWWRSFAEGFGISGQLEGEIEPPAQMEALNHYLWCISYWGSLAEAIGAVYFAVEGATGRWTKSVSRDIQGYRDFDWTNISRKSLRWLTAHAEYDDYHPLEALEIIKAYASTEREQSSVFKATRRSLEYYTLALDSCYEAFR
jgi:pyrroloquinoline quinone (PQQ) biosynthesis protein C